VAYGGIQHSYENLSVRVLAAGNYEDRPNVIHIYVVGSKIYMVLHFVDTIFGYSDVGDTDSQAQILELSCEANTVEISICREVFRNLYFISANVGSAGWMYINKCRQDDCYRTWVVGDTLSMTDMHRVDLTQVDRRFAEDAAPILSDPRHDTAVVSCADGDSYVEEGGQRTPEPEEDAPHATEDQSALWMGVCKNELHIVN
jgi:hypothetical protein